MKETIMEKITKEYEVCEYDELSTEAKEKVLENSRDINCQDYWYEYTLEDMTERLNEMGFEDAEIFFSGFWSQGDGASFKAQINIDKLCKYYKLNTTFAKLLKAYEITGKITQSGRYYHSNPMSIELDFETKGNYDAIRKIGEARQALLDKLSDEFENKVLTIARNEADKIYDELEKVYESYLTDESVIETLKANEFKFLKDGSVF